MPPRDRLAHLDPIARELPFDVEKHEDANNAFARWYATREDADRRVVELWAYCYVYRFALTRVVRETWNEADFEELVTRAFTQLQKNLEQVRDPARFTHWASVVCANVVNAYGRARVPVTSLDDMLEAGAELGDADEPEAVVDLDVDRVHVRRAVEAAVGRLSDAVRPIAEMRLLQGRSYERIAAATGHPVETVRAYAARATRQLSRDPALRDLVDELAWGHGEKRAGVRPRKSSLLEEERPPHPPAPS